MKFFQCILSLFVLVVEGQNSFCQSQNVYSELESRAMVESHNMKVKLSLDSVQYQQVIGINKRYNKKIDSVYRTSNSIDLKQSVCKELNKDRTKEFKLILSHQQFQQYKSDKEALKNRMNSRRLRNDISTSDIED